METPFAYRDGALCCDGVDLNDIAHVAGTPCYVYSADGISERYLAYDRAFGETLHQVCYAVKANSNLSVLRLLASLGAGFDIVSGGELFRVLQAGGDPEKIVFSGVGKTEAEIDYALRERVHTFNCESERELSLLDAIARRQGVRARVALRVNPDVDAATHPYISTGLRDHKFGIDIHDVERVYAVAIALPGLAVEGVSCHIGSQLLDASPLIEAVDKLVDLVARLRAQGVPITHLDLGGGLGVKYKPGQVTPAIDDTTRRMLERVAGVGAKIYTEPGRSIVGECGVLLAEVLYRKRSPRKEFVIVDAAMNDLIRPALYGAYHEILPLRERPRETIRADVVGPVCESGDFLAKDRDMAAVETGERIAFLTAGAYGFVLASNYNARPRACEVMVEGNAWRVVRARESYEDLTRGE